MVRFEQDQMVIPRDTAWLANYDKSGKVVQLWDSKWYENNTLGIRDMDRQGKLVFLSLSGGHVFLN